MVFQYKSMSASISFIKAIGKVASFSKFTRMSWMTLGKYNHHSISRKSLDKLTTITQHQVALIHLISFIFS